MELSEQEQMKQPKIQVVEIPAASTEQPQKAPEQRDLPKAEYTWDFNWLEKRGLITKKDAAALHLASARMFLIRLLFLGVGAMIILFMGNWRFEYGVACTLALIVILGFWVNKEYAEMRRLNDKYSLNVKLKTLKDFLFNKVRQ